MEEFHSQPLKDMLHCSKIFSSIKQIVAALLNLLQWHLEDVK